MSRVRKLSSCFLSLLLGAVSLPVWSQNKASNESEIDRLAARTADRVAKTAAHNVLVLTVQGCLLNPDICGSLDQQICTELRMRSPGIQLFSRADLLTLLPKHGLLPVDAYTGAAEAVAPDLGAEVMVTESLSWLEDGYEAEIRLTDLARA